MIRTGARLRRMSTLRTCSYQDCKRPGGSTQYFHIEAGRTSGDKDWSSLAGSTLCHTCYQQFKSRGTLERKKPLADSAKKCSYEQCDGAKLGRQFYEISETSTAGGKDWSSLKGRVLCHTCYCRYKSRGTLERSLNKPLSIDNKRCSYQYCDRPDQSCQFLQIDGTKTTGGQDWSSLAGSVLCNACYSRFKSRGTLERQGRAQVGGAVKQVAHLQHMPVITSLPVATVIDDAPARPAKRGITIEEEDGVRETTGAALLLRCAGAEPPSDAKSKRKKPAPPPEMVAVKVVGPPGGAFR